MNGLVTRRHRSRRTALLRWLLVCGALILASGARSDDLGYVSDDELTSEVTRRENDLERTRLRIELAVRDEIIASQRVSDTRDERERIDTALTARVRLLHRLSRQGGSLRYLLGSSSATSLLKRLGTLRYLVVDGLESRREAGLRLGEAESQLATTREEKQRAGEALTALEQGLAELKAERRRRQAAAVADDSLYALSPASDQK